VVGLTLVAGAVVLFQQAKASAQNVAAKEKVDSLFMLTEEMEARNFGLPGLDQLRTAWKARRPADYNTSPWGGTFTVTSNDFIDGNDTVGLSQEIGNSAAGTPFAGTTLADRGRLYYFRRDPAVAGSNYLWLDELGVYGPEDTESVYRVTGCGVGILDSQGRQWFYVMGKGKTNAGTAGRFTAEGQIGN